MGTGDARLDSAAEPEVDLLDVFLLELAEIEEHLALDEAARNVDGGR